MNQIMDWEMNKSSIIMELFRPECYRRIDMFQIYLNSELLKDLTIFKKGENVSLIFIMDGKWEKKILLYSDKFSPKFISRMVHGYFPGVLESFNYACSVIRCLGLNPGKLKKIVLFIRMFCQYFSIGDSPFCLYEYCTDYQKMLKLHILRLQKRLEDYNMSKYYLIDSLPLGYYNTLDDLESELQEYIGLHPQFWRKLPRNRVKKIKYIKNFMKEISKITGIKCELGIFEKFQFSLINFYPELERILGIRILKPKYLTNYEF